MSKQEAKNLKTTKKLRDPHDLNGGTVPVFDSPEGIERKLRGMRTDELRNYFTRIGVRQCQMVAFFDTENGCVGGIGPVRQTNGLREYRIPTDTKINNYAFVSL